MTIYRPRMAAVLHVPAAGTPAEREAQNNGNGPTIDLPVSATSAELESNDHNHADELNLTLDWASTGLDVRLIRNATVDFYLGEADEFGSWTPSRRNMRFCGVVVAATRHSGEGDPYQVDLRVVDYTDFFLRAKPFGSRGIPFLSETLDAAWRRIVSQTPGASVLANRLLWIGRDATDDRKQELRDVLNGKQRSLQNAPFPVLGDAVAERFRNLSQVVAKPDTDAWAVWQQCVGMLGLLSWIDRDWVVVIDAEDYYTEIDPPVFTWGTNVVKLSEGTESQCRKGIILSSFDPLTGRAIEARYTEKPQRKVKAHRGGATAETEEDRDWEEFKIPGVTSQDMLAKYAKRVYEERSRQELQGTLVTGEMRVFTRSTQPQPGKSPGEPSFELLDLRHGDDVMISFNDDARDALLGLPDVHARYLYLLGRGYDQATAQILANNTDSLAFFSPIFYVKQVRTRLKWDEEVFEVEVCYTNKLSSQGTGDT